MMTPITGMLIGVLIFLGSLVWWFYKKDAPDKSVETTETTQITNTEISPTDGFLQLEGRELFSGETKLQIGRPFRMKYHLFNRGPRPIHDVQSWGTFISALQSSNPDENIRKMYIRSTNEAYRKFISPSDTVGINQEIWNIAVGEPLTSEQIDGLSDGTFRMWFLLSAFWKNEKGDVQQAHWCRRIESFGPGMDTEAQPWKICD